MDGQNLSYALVQVVHNVGAVSVAGAAAFARLPMCRTSDAHVLLARVVVAGWIAQALSGAGFGAISYAYYGQFPDLHGIAVAALVIKMLCALAGFAMAASYLRRHANWTPAGCRRAWDALLGLAATALVAAAFLRWFS
jgi:hypothetical protein